MIHYYYYDYYYYYYYYYYYRSPRLHLMQQREKLHKAFSGLGLDTKGLKTSLSIIDQDILKTLLEQRVMTPKELRALKQKAADERAEAKYKAGGVLKKQVNNERQTLQAMGGFLLSLKVRYRTIL